jgi:DNA-binding MarR family transcriptional regulator
MNENITDSREDSQLLIALEQAAHIIDNRRDLALKAHHLSSARLGVLKHLVEANEPLTLGQLASRVTCVKSNITQIIDRLEQEGLVKRVPDAADRRCMRAVVTEEGCRCYALGLQAELETERQLLERLSPGERQTLTLLLGKFHID